MATLFSKNEIPVPENVTSHYMSRNWTSDTEPPVSKTTYSTNPEEGIISHHRDLMDWSLAHSNNRDNREFLDRPLMGIAIIGGFFLLISLLLVVAVVVFYLKRNTVFVLEKSVHGGMYRQGDQSVVIGQTATARDLGRHVFRSDKERSNRRCVDDVFEDDEVYSDAEFTDEAVQEVSFQQVATPNLSCAPALGSYVLHSDHLVFTNPEYRNHLPSCNHRFKQSKILEPQALLQEYRYSDVTQVTVLPNQLPIATSTSKACNEEQAKIHTRQNQWTVAKYQQLLHSQTQHCGPEQVLQKRPRSRLSARPQRSPFRKPVVEPGCAVDQMVTKDSLLGRNLSNEQPLGKNDSNTAEIHSLLDRELIMSPETLDYLDKNKVEANGRSSILAEEHSQEDEPQ
ncbi:hypothetical protein FGIG_04230 [Fasciola gigantica]|uniref:Uncharacterized protein n=1 Tax=Fasciola gigantica TaxID=46835 RepID=A0A504YGV1_FASGI|nr:hypothetical protein FGIG_04230 [Fasciola gigantica]